jgi:hypothetical protein
MDRLPNKPRFAIGTRLRYIGDTISRYGCNDCARKSSVAESWVECRRPGLEVTIVEHRLGRQGTLRPARDEDGPMYYEDTGEPILDTTSDGYCLYQVACPRCGKKMYGPIVGHDNEHEWKEVKKNATR